MEYKNAFKYDALNRVNELVMTDDGVQMYMYYDTRNNIIKYIDPRTKTTVIGSIAATTAPEDEIEHIVSAVFSKITAMGFIGVKIARVKDGENKNRHTSHLITATYHPVRNVVTAMMNLVSGEHAIVFDYDYGKLNMYLSPYTSWAYGNDAKRWWVKRTSSTWNGLARALRAIDPTIAIAVGYSKPVAMMYTSPKLNSLQDKKAEDERAEKIEQLYQKIESQMKNIAKWKEDIDDASKIIDGYKDELKLLENNEV